MHDSELRLGHRTRRAGADLVDDRGAGDARTYDHHRQGRGEMRDRGETPAWGEGAVVGDDCGVGRGVDVLAKARLPPEDDAVPGGRR